MRFIFLFQGGELQHEHYIMSGWAKTLAVRGSEVEVVLPYGEEGRHFGEHHLLVRWIIQGEKLNLQGDACFMADTELYSRLGGFAGVKYLVWNRYLWPPRGEGMKLVCFSRPLMDFFQEQGIKNVNYLPPYLDRRLFESLPLEEEGNKNRLLFIGGRQREREYRLTLAAADLIRSSLPGLELYTLGMDSPAIPAITPVKHMAWPVAINDRIRLYHGARVVIWGGGDQLQAFNPFGLEILACNRPLFIFNPQGLMEYANPGENCLFFAPGDGPKQVAVKVLGVLRHGHKLARITGEGRRCVRDYIPTTNSDEIENLTLQLMGIREGEIEAVTNDEHVDIVIVSYNNLEMLQKCLASIKEYTQIPFRITVVDNGSEEGLRNFLKSGQDIQTIFNDKNRGYAHACNQGILNGQGEFIVLLNSDVEVQEGWLETMVACARRDEQIAVVGPKMVNEENLIVGAGVSDFNDICSPRGWKMPDGPGVFDEEEDVINVGGACYMIRRSLLPKFGLFDERFFFYYEETDYSLRAREKGYRVVYCPQARVTHHHEAGGKGVDRVGRNRYFAQSRHYFQQKWADLLAEEGLKRRRLERTILVFGVIPWRLRFQRPQQLLTRFARQGYRILYINPFLSAEGLREQKEGLFTYSPPGFGTALLNLRYLSKRHRMARAIKETMAKLGIIRPILWVDAPYWEPLVKYFEYSLLVYNCMDAYQEFIDLNNHPTLAQEEERLLEDCDLVLTPSKLLYEKMKERNANTYHVANGADLNTFGKVLTERLAEPEELKDLERPLVLYYGAVAHWFDVELVKSLALEMGKGSLVLIGEVSEDVSKLEAIPRVCLLGERLYSELPAFLQASQLCIIPFKKNLLTEAADPVKVYEYLAGGRPVISVKLPELEKFADTVTLADGEDFVNAVLGFISEHPEGLSREQAVRLQKKVKDESWEQRLKQIEDLFYEIYSEEKPEYDRLQAKTEEAVTERVVEEPAGKMEEKEPVCEDDYPEPEDFWQRAWRWLRGIFTGE